jgi:hypothetical protein
LVRIARKARPARRAGWVHGVSATPARA